MLLSSCLSSCLPALSSCLAVYCRYETAKCASAGFVSGLAGAASAAVALPAAIAGNVLVQLRMVQACALLCGENKALPS